MNKGLEALKEYRNQQIGVIVFADDYLAIIEKELKALEIIKRLPADYIKDLIVFIREFPNDTFCDFIAWGGDETPILINEEEYDLLKEVLL